jgi:methyl-accepting chemotaxis protein
MAFNRMQMDRVMAEQAASARTDAAFERLRAGAGHVRAVAPVERDMLLAQGGPAIGAARDRALAELEAAAPLLAGSGGTLGEQLGAYRAAVEALAEQRLRLVGLRDQDLARATEDYDAVQEAVQSGIGFDLTGAAQEEAREKLGAVQAAANDVRIGIQRLLATGEEAQARRVRRGAAQIRVHARGLLAVEAPDSLRSDVRRLSEAGERLGAAALEVIAAGDAVAKLRAERLAPAEAALAASVATLSAGLQAEAARQRAEVVEAVAEVNAANIWAGLGVVLVLVLSGVANARAIGTPMRRLSAAIARIAAGKAGEPVPDRGRRDEIGRIADALESLRGTVGRAFAQGQMIEQLPLAVMGCDPGADFQVTYMNATSRELLGPAARPPALRAGGAAGPVHRRAAPRPAPHPRPAVRARAAAAHGAHPPGRGGDGAARLRHPRRGRRLLRVPCSPGRSRPRRRGWPTPSRRRWARWSRPSRPPPRSSRPRRAGCRRPPRPRTPRRARWPRRAAARIGRCRPWRRRRRRWRPRSARSPAGWARRRRSRAAPSGRRGRRMRRWPA